MRNYLEKRHARPDRRRAQRPDHAARPAPAAARHDGRRPRSGAVSNEAALTAPPPAAARTASAAPAAPAAPSAPARRLPTDIYAKAGISLYKPDGTKKTDTELRAELQAYYLAQKKAKNPNYGTVFNIGNIFKDE